MRSGGYCGPTTGFLYLFFIDIQKVWRFFFDLALQVAVGGGM
jgi:hypothetical protein